MHYATLVTLEVEKDIPDGERQELFRQTVSSIDAETGKNKDSSVVLEALRSEAVMRSTAFSDAVATGIEGLLGRYFCDTDDPEYLEFDDRTEDFQEEYETGTVNVAIMPDGTVLTEDRIEFCRKYEVIDGRAYEKNWGPLHHRKVTKASRRIRIMQDVPYKDIYPSFEEYMDAENGWCPYQEQEKAYGFYFNPDAYYDWYSIGGRWPDMFLIEDSCPEYVTADRSWACPEERKAPEGCRWTCGARKKDICWRLMYECLINEAKERYRKMKKAFEDKRMPDGYYGEITDDGIRGCREMLYIKGESEEDYMDRFPVLTPKAYPVQIYSYLDEGEWKEKESFVYDAENSRIEKNKEFDTELEQFIDGLDDDTVLAIVDCHM